MLIQQYFVCVILLGVSFAQDYDDIDEKYRPDAIPVWENERKDYTFSYGVKDLNTGDVKNQWEKKVGDTIYGHYTVLEPDGSLRIVHYTADEKNGFNAVVKHEGPSYHPVISSHTRMQFVTKPPLKSTTKHLSHAKPAPIEEPLEDTQSVKIESDSDVEHINAYLYIPSQHHDPDEVKVHYELVSDDSYQHFVNYNAPVRSQHKNHKPVYTPIQPNYKTKTGVREQPIGYDMLTPVAIDLSQIDLDNYKQGVFTEPQIETGFRPFTKTKAPETGHIPNTFTTNKKPITTPGLKTYASDVSHHRPHLRGPVIFPKRMDKEKLVQYSTSKNKNSGLRYITHVAYFPDY